MKRQTKDSFKINGKRKIIMANDNFTKPFKTYLEEVAIYNFINNIIRELVMTKECNEDFKNSTKC